MNVTTFPGDIEVAGYPLPLSVQVGNLLLLYRELDSLVYFSIAGDSEVDIY